MGRAVVAGALAAIALCACGHGGATPQSLADDTTKAVYNDDLNAVQARFDDALKRTVTIDQVATISKKMHVLGAYKGLTQTSADGDNGRYNFTAQFESGTGNVHLRMDPGGRISAYHVDLPNAAVK